VAIRCFRAVAFVPVFLANLVFARRSRDVASSNVAFGANLLGAMVGGVLEYVSLITGYRALLILVGALWCGIRLAAICAHSNSLKHLSCSSGAVADASSLRYLP
jgi:hypothetical protein